MQCRVDLHEVECDLELPVPRHDADQGAEGISSDAQHVMRGLDCILPDQGWGLGLKSSTDGQLKP